MDNPVIQEEVSPAPQPIPQEIKPKKSRVKVLLIIFISLLVLCLAGVSYLYFKNGSNFLNIFNKVTEEEEYKQTESEKEANALKPGDVMIAGTFSFPSEIMPSMKVCAVNTESKEETCIQTPEGANNYTLTVQSGSYLIYTSAGRLKAYYTACDTYTNSQEDPRCNSNYIDGDVNWNSQDFICYEDTVCKAAFTPLVVTLTEDQESITLEEIVQGWYIPCSHDTDVCNDDTFDVWSDYIQ